MKHPEVVPYTFLLPLQKVVRRVANPPGTLYFDETLECGHTLRGLRKGRFDRRRCSECPPAPPPLKGVEIVLDDTVPYEQGNTRRPGWYYLNGTNRLSLKPTNRVRMHPACHAAMPAEAFARTRLKDGLCEVAWECPICGLKGTSTGGKAAHGRMHARGTMSLATLKRRRKAGTNTKEERDGH
jgi:hypothetical protein